LPAQGARARTWANAVALEVRDRVDAEHARRGQRGGSIDRDDFRVRVRRAQQDEVDLAGHREIVYVAAFAAQQARILEARNGLTDAEVFIHSVRILI